jgi:phosphinothricin acetyltransferase
MTKPRIRDATVDDAPSISAIYGQSIAAGDATMVESAPSEDEVRGWIRDLGKREAILVLEHQGAVVGWGLIKQYSERQGYRFTCETSVFIDREHTGQGHGTRIKAAQIERCRAMGYHHMLARIMAVNTASIEYNKRFGYEVVGRQREAGFKNGRWQDIVILQLVLDDVPAEIPAAYRDDAPPATGRQRHNSRP